MQQRCGQRGRPLAGIAGHCRAEPVREPDRPGPAGDGPAQQSQCQQHPADHAVAARHQPGTKAHEVLGRLHGAGQVAARAARRELSWTVLARQPGRVLGGRVEPGQDPRAVVEPGPGQRSEHRRGIPPADDPDVQAAGQHPAPARPAVAGTGRGDAGRGIPRAGNDRVRQPDRVRRRHRDHPRFGHGVGEFQVDGVRQRGQDLAMAADAAQQVPDRQAGHSCGHRGLGARVSARWGSSHVRNSTPGPPGCNRRA